MDYMYIYVVLPLCVMGVVVDKLFKIYTGVVKVQYSQRHRHITHLGDVKTARSAVCISLI
jgi:hypothetical protein